MSSFQILWFINCHWLLSKAKCENAYWPSMLPTSSKYYFSRSQRENFLKWPFTLIPHVCHTKMHSRTSPPTPQCFFPPNNATSYPMDDMVFPFVSVCVTTISKSISTTWYKWDNQPPPKNAHFISNKSIRCQPKQSVLIRKEAEWQRQQSALKIFFFFPLGRNMLL